MIYSIERNGYSLTLVETPGRLKALVPYRIYINNVCIMGTTLKRFQSEAEQLAAIEKYEWINKN